MRTVILISGMLLSALVLSAQSYNFDDCDCLPKQTSNLSVGDTVFSYCSADKISYPFERVHCSALDTLIVGLKNVKNPVLNVYAVRDETNNLRGKSDEAPGWFRLLYNRAAFTRSYLKMKGVETPINCFCYDSDSLSRFNKKLNFENSDECRSFIYVVISNPELEAAKSWIVTGKELDTKGRLSVTGSCMPNTNSYPFYSEVINYMHENTGLDLVFHIYASISESDSLKADKINILGGKICQAFYFMGIKKGHFRYEIHWNSNLQGWALKEYIHKITFKLSKSILPD